MSRVLGGPTGVGIFGWARYPCTAVFPEAVSHVVPRTTCVYSGDTKPLRPSNMGLCPHICIILVSPQGDRGTSLIRGTSLKERLLLGPYSMAILMAYGDPRGRGGVL